MILFDILRGSQESRRFTRRTRMMMAAGLVSSLLLLPGCGDKTGANGGAGGEAGAQPGVSSQEDGDKASNLEQAAKAQAVPNVNVVKIKTAKINFQHEWPATTDTLSDVEVRARVEGKIENFDCQEGSLVHEGEVLFTLDDAPYRAEVQAASANLAKANADLMYAKSQVNVRTAEASVASAKVELNKAQLDVNRYKPLAASGTIPAQTFDNAVAARDVAQANLSAAQANLANTKLQDRANIDIAKAAVEAAQARLTQANLNLSYCTILCPVTGIIGKLNVTPGNLVGQAGNTAPLVTISDLDPIDLVVGLSENEYLMMVEHVKDPDQFVQFEMILSNGEIYPHKGKFRMIDRNMDVTTGTMGVRISFANPDNALREGQYGKLRITSLTPTDQVVVPQRAVMTVQNGQSVYVVGANNMVENRVVKVGDIHEDDFIVESGLKVGDMVIVDGLQTVKPGIPCNPTEVAK